jgi:hypothetical protein
MSTPTMAHCSSACLSDKQALWEKEPDVDNHYDVVESGIRDQSLLDAIIVPRHDLTSDFLRDSIQGELHQRGRRLIRVKQIALYVNVDQEVVHVWIKGIFIWKAECVSTKGNNATLSEASSPKEKKTYVDRAQVSGCPCPRFPV